jgi:hypothetical protein
VVLLCLTSLSTIFQQYRFIGGETGVSGKAQTCCDQFHYWKKTDKTTGMTKLREKHCSTSHFNSDLVNN